MRETETADQKIRKICDSIKSQAIDPAKQQAREIIENARLEAQQIKEEAEKEKEAILLKTQEDLEKQKKLFTSLLHSASKQTLEKLKQDLEKHFFRENLHELVVKAAQDPQIIAKLIETIIQTIQKEGLSKDLSALAPSVVGTDKINLLLAKDILDKLQEKKVIEEPFLGGAKIKLHDKQVTIDISDEALVDLISEYIRKDFRDLLFNV